jgi:type VI secretion system protein ImpJ
VKHLERVVWSEGMALGPHHFQAQALYFEDSIHFATSALWFAAYGFLALELDSEALRNGTVALIYARGLFQDGLGFQIPDGDAPPDARNIVESFPPLKDRLMLYLAIPATGSEGASCALEDSGAADARYVAEVRQLHDENTGRDERPVRLGKKNIRFLLENESLEGMVALPAARILRTGTGQFHYDPDYIPPCLQVSSSERLVYLMSRMLEVLADKSASFQRTAPAAGGLSAGFSQLEVSNFWFLHCVNSSLAALRNLLLSKRGHPEEVYRELSKLAGALCTFGIDSHPSSLPLYQHDDLEKCFHEIDQHIRMHLDAIVPTNCVTIPLEPVGNYLYTGHVADQRCLGRSQWIFSIRAALGEADLIRLTPQLVKVCSQEFVPKLVQRALPGMTMSHLQVPPSAVAPKVEHQYYMLSRSGPCWEHIVQTKQVGVYVPGDFPNAEIALHVILES